MRKRNVLGLAIGTIALPSFVLLLAPAAHAENCDEYARRRARREEGGIVREGAWGAIGGALVGGIFGDASAGARIGATVRGVGGGLSKRRRRDDAYNRAYNECIRNSGAYIQPLR